MDIENLNKNDVIVFWGGTCEVIKNNSQKGLRQLVDFTKKKPYKHCTDMCPA
jgi:hypothetical protein